jgi:cysteine desulfurase
VGKIPINLKETSIDILALSGHKLHAPKGIGAIFVRKGIRLEPLIHGGHQRMVGVLELKMFLTLWDLV